MAQLLVEGGEPERNFERAEKLIAEAALEGCQIVLLPETIDFAWTHPSALTESLPIPGPFSDHFSKLAQKFNIWICVGLTEKASPPSEEISANPENIKIVESTGPVNYNAALLFDNKGLLRLKYHKINLLVVEHPFYRVGKTLNVIESPWGQIGINICADNYMDGLTIGHTLARMGAQIILSPSSWTVDYSVTEQDDPYNDKWVKPLSLLAKLYGMVVISTTSVGYIVGGPYEGKKKVGCSLAVGPDGIIKQGMMNEFAGELQIVEFEVPARPETGTQIGEMLAKKGVRFDW